MLRSLLIPGSIFVATMFMAVCLGGSIDVGVPTLGKQLEDLERPRSSGAISEVESGKRSPRCLESGGITRDLPVVLQDEGSDS
jgi:hypothetical protein